MDPSWLLGADHLDEVAELRFALRFERGDQAEERRWSWSPASGRVVRHRPGEPDATLRLGHATTERERALEAAFYEDTFWLAPQLHLSWAASAAEVVSLGATSVDGRAAEHVQLRYRSDGGGYTPGDTHELYLAPGQGVVAWAMQRPGGPETRARFTGPSWLGPLRVADVRTLADGTVVRLTERAWTPVDLAVAVDPGGTGAAVTVSATRCRLGGLEVPRMVSPPAPHAVPSTGDADAALVVRDGASREVHGWSTRELGFADPEWLARTGFTSCDLWVVDEASMRAALAAVADDERPGLVALVLAWSLAQSPVPAPLRPLFGQVQAAARDCAQRSDCDALLAWFVRLR